MTTPSKLLPLFEKLKTCPSLDSSITEKMLLETWGCFKQLALEQGDELTPPIMAGLILYDEEQFAELLNEAERLQMIALSKKALERYKQLTNPPNKLGKTIAASLKESK